MMDVFEVVSEKQLSVSQLNRQAKKLLEQQFGAVWVSGELTNLAQPSSGHWYFSLKDDQAQVRCAMFRQANQRVRWQVKAGQQVLVRAQVSLYEGRGDYQLIVNYMEESGLGALQRAYEELKQRLQQEGLFDERHKRTLPRFPTRIGVITSPTGAAIHDILQVLQRRYPLAEVIVIPTAVQGDTAARALCQAVHNAVRYHEDHAIDVLIIGRGGGSLEDLWAFNDEHLARAIATCPIPVVSAVGHEVDFTICDFVADVRAPTPSASAELVSPDQQEWQLSFDDWQQGLIKKQRMLLQQKQQALLVLRSRLRHPGQIITQQKTQVIELKRHLQREIQQQVQQKKQFLSLVYERLQAQHPQTQIENYRLKLEHLQQRLLRQIQQVLEKKQQQWVTLVQVLNAVSPLHVLQRGYSITSDEGGQVLHSAARITQGQIIKTRLQQGVVTSQVLAVDL